MYKLKISSSLKPYGLEFTNNYNKDLKKLYSKGDLILIDSIIFLTYGLPKFINKLAIIIIKTDESKKEYLYIAKIISDILKKDFSKKNKIICIGGGILQDICSFISLILFRGFDWVFFPTTLLSQADSCIGGKVSINFNKYKNQIGNYYPPNWIYIDMNFLLTLKKNQFYSGIGEIMHFYLLSSRRDFLMIKNNLDLLLNRDKKTMLRIISRCLEIKKKYIESDEFDNGIRNLLNYGHTFGHALESVTNYKIPHGIAVAHGMNIANFISYEYGYLSKKNFNNMQNILSKIYSFKYPKKFDQNKFQKFLLKDKKTLKGVLSIILSKRLGKVFIKKQKLDRNFIKILNKYFYIYFNF